MRFLFLSALAGLTTLMHAQSAFTVYDVTNSILQSNLVNCITHDADGNMWVGTEQGLVYRSVDGTWDILTEADGLPGNEIRSVMVDGDKLFVGTYLDGMAVLEGGVWSYYDPTNSPMPDYHVKCFSRDSYDTIWIGTSWGLTKWDGADYWHTYTELNSELLIPNINALYTDSNDIMYAGTVNGGLARYSNGTFEIFRTANSNIGDNTILSIDEDIYNNKWLATSFGALSVLTEDDVFLRFTPLTSAISDWSIDAVRLDNDNIAMIGMTSTGLEVFDNVNWTQYTAENSDLPDNVIHAIGIGIDNIVWLGTDNGGLAAFDKNYVEAVHTAMPSNILVYPNPASDNVYMGNWNEQVVIHCYDVLGTLKAEGTIINGVATLSVLNLPAGNYIVTVTGSGVNATAVLSVSH